ncbi:VanZ family protein [Streptomyces sp. cmx-18-6]|uniref:VanZ family protein n=1 Tax=Streptomyces sp. cmx-18-6 TaxID=2790930 RepID=UPI003980D5D4
MINAIFNGQEAFIVTMLICASIAAALGYLAARRISVPVFPAAALAAALVGELALTLFMGSGNSDSRTCVVNRSLEEPFLTEQGWLNIALFVPIGFFGVLTLRRLAPVVSACLALTLMTELGQALLPGVGRGCDTSDLLTNFSGGLLGIVVAWCWLSARGRNNDALYTWVRPSVIAAVAAVALSGVMAAAFLTLVPMDATTLRPGGAKEREVAEKALKSAFGDRYDIANVQIQPGMDGMSDRLLVALGESGSVEVSWPDGNEMTAYLDRFDSDIPDGFPVEGVTEKPASDEDALRIARRYAGQAFPWGLADSRATVEALGDKGKKGWIVRWRRSDSAGVLMPMRLDVQITRAGHVSQLLARHIENPTNLPSAKIGRKKAESLAVASVAGPEGLSELKAAGSELIAVRRSGTWKAQWLVGVTSKDGQLPAAPVYIDAVTGDVDNGATGNDRLEPLVD